MKRVISAVIAFVGFYTFPNLLATDLLERHTIGIAVYVVYVVAVLSLVYYVESVTAERIKNSYRQAEKAAEKAVFHEKMKAYSETEEKYNGSYN